MPLSFWTDPILIDFVLGAGIAVIYKSGVRLRSKGQLGLLGLSVVPLFFAAGGYGFGDLSRLWTLDLTAALLIAAGVLGEEIKPVPAVVFLSKATYSIYLSHIIFLKVCEMSYKFLGDGYIILSSIAAVSSGCIAYLLLEKPMNKILTKRIPAHAP
jgi:peptidoglycan/LPS O-acetylase OafA/YrhL